MIARAQLVEIRWSEKQQTAEPTGNDAATVKVQFNPETLKLTYANQNAGGDQPAGSSKQFVGSGTSKLAVDLLFDTSIEGTDVRQMTSKVAHYIKAQQPPGGGDKRVPPGVSFEWGSFVFRGVVDSMSETIDYFSEDGKPLRATVSLGISRQEIEFFPTRAGGDNLQDEGTPGTRPLDQALEGDSMRSVAERNNAGDDWKSIAEANDIDNPLRLPPGQMIDTARRA